MCGRYTMTAGVERLRVRFRFSSESEIPARYNIAPTQLAPVVVMRDTRAAEMMRWGLIPSWAKDRSIGNRMINARAETLREKPAFKRLIASRRCLILADGFYEWKKEEKIKQPMRFVLQSGEPFAFAGLWDEWLSPDAGSLRSFTIITTSANSMIQPVHERMPVILRPDDEEKWLDPASRPDDIESCLAPLPPGLMSSYPVSRAVNSPVNDTPECVQPITTEATETTEKNKK